jgi:hypothetical protein
VQENVTAVINAKVLELLIAHCPLLKRTELVGNTDPGVDYVFGELKRQILLQNVDLKFKLTDAMLHPNYELYTKLFY